MRNKVKRRTFCFPPRTEALLDKLQEKMDLSYSAIVKEGLELLAEKKGVTNE